MHIDKFIFLDAGSTDIAPLLKRIATVSHSETAAPCEQGA
jgi:hypothetical protein